MSRGLIKRVFAMKDAEEFVLDAKDGDKDEKVFVYSRKGHYEVSASEGLRLEEADFADPFLDAEKEDAAVLKLLNMAINAAHMVCATGGVLTWTAMSCCFDTFDGTSTYSSVPGHVHGPTRKNPIKNVIVNPKMTEMLIGIGALGKDKIGRSGEIGKMTLASRQVGNATFDEKTGKFGKMEVVVVPERRAGIYVTKQCPEMTLIMAGRPNNIGFCIKNAAGKIAMVITNSKELGAVTVVADDSALYVAKKKAS